MIASCALINRHGYFSFQFTAHSVIPLINKIFKDFA